jgi:pyruvate-formate lyase-activating enzyme
MITSLEPLIDPANRISFLIDWELTKKCNLDCSYCSVGVDYGGHDNSVPHPPLGVCLKTIDFMFKYVDLYMTNKVKGIKYVMLNVYGGEALAHPDIIDILKACREKQLPYKDRWHLTITTTTNAIVSKKRLQELLCLIDEFTVSYHSESTVKQKKIFKQNLLTIQAAGKRQKCIVPMHHNLEYFKDCQQMIEWLEENDIKLLPKQLDISSEQHIDILDREQIYQKEQIVWFDKLYHGQIYNLPGDTSKEKDSLNLSNVGRACCGGRQLCQDQNYKQKTFYVDNKFTDWFCSVNHFFVFLRQVTGEIFVNKDCKMKFDGSVGSIGNLVNADQLLSELQDQIQTNSIPTIQCSKNRCLCGVCAPKAKNLETYNKIMEKYLIK